MNFSVFLTLFYPIFLTSIAVGPVFITTANISITYGLKNGLFSVVGVAFGNILYMFIGALTAQSLIVAIPDKVMLFVSFLATLFLIYIAIGFWRKTITNIEKTKAFKQNFKTILKMFTITLSSPIVIAGYSITFLTFASAVRKSFFSAIFGGITSAIIAYSLIAVVFGLLGKKIKKLQKEKYLKLLVIFNKTASVLLLGFASITLFNFFRTIFLMFIK